MYFTKSVVIKACIYSTGFAKDSLHVGSVCFLIYVRALRNLSGLKPWQIARTMECSLSEVYSALLISISPGNDEAYCQTYLRLVKAKAEELSKASKQKPEMG